MPFKKGNPGCPCCQTGCYPCDKCLNSDHPTNAGFGPCCFSFTVSGIANGYPSDCYCDYCGDFNGDWIVSKNGPFEGYNCCWTGTICTAENGNTTSHCIPVDVYAVLIGYGLDRWELCLQQDGITNQYRFRLRLNSVQGYGIVWRSGNLTSGPSVKPDCLNFTDPITLTFDSYSNWGGTSLYYKCDASASTVELHPNNVGTFAECPDRGSTCNAPHGCAYCRDLKSPVSFTVNAGSLGTFELSHDSANSCHYSYSGGGCTVGLSISWSSGTFLTDGCYLSVGVTCGACGYSYNWHQFDDLDCIICDCESIGTVTIACSGASSGCHCADHPSITVTANY